MTRTHVVYDCGCEAAGDLVAPTCPIHGRDINPNAANPRTLEEANAEIDLTEQFAARDRAILEREAEIERLNKLMAGDMATVRMQLDGFDVQHWSARLLALSFFDSLGDAPNYMQLELSLPDKGSAVVTIRRKHGKHPEEVLKERLAAAEAENERLAAEASGLRVRLNANDAKMYREFGE